MGEQNTLVQGIILLGVYSLGLAVPFLLTSLLMERFLKFYSRFRSHMHALEVASGGLLIAVALLTGVMAFAKDGKPPAAVADSRLAPYVSQGSRVFVVIAPHELKEGFRKTYEEARSAWNSAVERRIHGRPKAEKDEHEKRI